MEIEWIEAMIKRSERDRKIVKILSIEMEPAVGKGENYLSVIHRAKLRVVLGSGKTTNRFVIIKCLPETEYLRAFITDSGAFKCEINMYTNVLSQLELLMDDFNDQDEKLWGDILGYKKFSMVMMEDLKVKNYKGVKRQDLLDIDHALLAAKSIARFHAMSFALLKRCVVSKDDFKIPFFIKDPVLVKQSFTDMLEHLEDAVKTDWGPEWVSLPDKLAKLRNGLVEKLIEMGKVDDSRFNVINHGDFWSNNMLFKYDANNKPSSMKFVDFQMCNYNSFAWDVTYFMYNSVKGNVRRDRYDDIIKTYHESLSKTLLFYGEQDVPSLQSLYDEMERVKFFGIILLCSHHAVMCSEPADAIDIEKAIERKENSESEESGITHLALFTSKTYMENVKPDFRLLD